MCNTARRRCTSEHCTVTGDIAPCNSSMDLIQHASQEATRMKNWSAHSDDLLSATRGHDRLSMLIPACDFTCASMSHTVCLHFEAHEASKTSSKEAVWVRSQKPPSGTGAIGLVGLPLLCRFRAVLACFCLCPFFSVFPSPPLPPALLSPTTKKGENRRPVKRRSGLSTGRPVCRGLKVDDIRSVSGGSGLSSGRPVCKWTTSALSINIQNAEHPVCKWTPKTSGL